MSEKIYTQQELTDAFRAAIEDRATWFYLMIKAAEKQGTDVEKMAEEAITEFGRMKGEKMGAAKDPGEFVLKLSTGHANQAFEMERVQHDENKGILKFRYCALVEAWKKLGCSPEEVAKLCKLARCGDYGVVSCSPGLKLDFPQLLSEGDECCELVVTKE
ncbi:L-2-amino-thiazoline-4-carboxylic acid hydrolase [Anaerosolibacter sp.]|jgi:hypothetical protein|uniref:L-2-amino-thiazoline-4-carboxylic acid hydrolase n=1 Tax=Anaerosolibacter sp. TaxID=1872527 RepID=UPI0026209664|nr:L-2-amino-thiazoline-4-carboxylic acid hydrolase [Anaerosolibacter sp.]MDF2548230.1 hypothetical protein [Anaerosolibacter sp.]